MNKIQVLPLLSDDEVEFRPIHQCLTPKLTEHLDNMSDEVRELPLLELEDRLQITTALRQLKISFWAEYHRTIVESKKSIDISTVCSGICNREFFYAAVVRRQEMFAWLLHPPTEFDVAAVEALSYGIDKLREEILTAPLYAMNPDGSRGAFNKDNATVVLNAIKFLDARVKGSPLQRIEQKNLHLHKTMEPTKGVSREDLDRELQEIRNRLAGGQMQLPPPPEDIE